eukprot:GHVU01139664.1.p1 GENE.GHVU01139664.1~~GHVU01139664.1.p1  ORF type:complete len:101 (-),score=1.35 GHVU01139664.1:343-645(-)
MVDGLGIEPHGSGDPTTSATSRGESVSYGSEPDQDARWHPAMHCDSEARRHLVGVLEHRPLIAADEHPAPRLHQHALLHGVVMRREHVELPCGRCARRTG